MSYTGSTNLINLSLEGDIPCCNTQNKTECEALLSKDITEPFLLTQSWPRSDGLANNPFDSVQDIVNREDDPFDSIEKQAYLKAQLSSNLQTEVKVANLLSLSNDNILDGESPSMALEVKGKITENQLNLESTPVNTNGKLSQNSESDSNTQSSAENSGSAKLKSGGEYRKRLLKLSISNAAFTSPVTHRNTSKSDDNFGTPVSTVLSRAAEFGEDLLASESPLKLVDDDMTESLIDSEKNFEADLEMLRIPMLNDLPSPAIQSLSVNTNSPEISASKTPTLENTLPSLEAIKAKLKAKKDERDNNHQQEIVSLIQNLKHLITSGDIIDENKKQQAGVLLESLSSALKPSAPKENLQIPQEPQPVKRQGTFDIELQKNEEIPEPESQPLAQEIDTCMISSSGTYDGEATDKNLNLPEITEISPINEPQQNDRLPNWNATLQNPSQTDVNNIVDELSRLLINNSADNSQNIQNPTVFVVMNSNTVNQSINSTNSSLDAKQRSAFVASYLENSINDGSPDLTKVDPMSRRRSQSLSTYDNVKIFRLSLPLPSPRSVQNDNNMPLNDSQTVATTPPNADMESPEFQTPTHMVRRNSYSSGTPYTAQLGLRRTSLVSDGKNSSIQLRKGQGLDTHHEERQQRPLVRPIAIPPNNMSAFKPDLKKKGKQNTESIIKSSGPLKATIPMKKYAPTLKTSPPTPDASKTSSSLHTLPKTASRLPSTPRSVKESSALLVPGAGYPNACSTPAAITTPLKHTRGSISKPRYSYMSTTPNAAKPASTSVRSESLKRRTMTDFKAKSPLRPRVSSVGVASTVTAAAATSSRIGNSRLSTSAGARIVKTPAKSSTVTNTATLKPTGNLSFRASIGGTGLSTRNKENKRP